MSKLPNEGNVRREEAIQEVEEMRKKIAEKRAELRGIRDRFRQELEKANKEKQKR